VGQFSKDKKMKEKNKIKDAFQNWMGTISVDEIVSNYELVERIELFLKRLKTGR